MTSKSSVTFQERELMYRLIISQLFYDGHQEIAVRLSNTVKASPACAPSDKLANVLEESLRKELEKEIAIIAPSQQLDLEVKADVLRTSPEPFTYDVCYSTTHKAPVRAAAFTPDGQLVATGSDDSSIKILDVSRMMNKIMNATHDQPGTENHPVIRTLYHNTGEVSVIRFHPLEQMLLTGSSDSTLKFFDYTKASQKRSVKTFQEKLPVKDISFHPDGEYFVCGVMHPVLRLYNTETGQCYVSHNPADQHTDTITSVHYSPSGRLYVSSGDDGDIRVWDAISGRCVNVLQSAHDEKPVISVQFSSNSKYVLSAGIDSLVKLWEMSTGRCLVAYTGAGATGLMEYPVQAVFNHTEDFVLFPDEKTGNMCSWDARNAERQRLFDLGHPSTVRCVAHSPTAAAMLTGGEEGKAKFWYSSG